MRGSFQDARGGGRCRHTVAIPKLIVPTNLHIETVCAAIAVLSPACGDAVGLMEGLESLGYGVSCLWSG